MPRALSHPPAGHREVEMRFIAGAFPAQGQTQPLNGALVPWDGTAPVWTVGHDLSQVSYSPALGGTAEVVAIGNCLATPAELREARDAAERGTWEHASRLPGSYLAVVRTRGTVRVIGDRAGVQVVYWLSDGEQVTWSTSALALAARTGARPDTAVLLAPLTLHGVDHLGSRSYFEGVHRVEPGRALVLEQGRAPRTEAVAPSLSGLSLREGATELAGHLHTAVQRRTELTASISADLSGGIDSSALASLAAAHGPVMAVTYTDGLLADQDDLHYARRIAADLTTLTHTEVNGTTAGVGHFDGLHDPQRLPLTDSPSLTLGLLAIKRAQLAPALAYGSRLHLTGRGGDNVLDSTPMSLIDLALSGGRRTAAQRLYAFARTRTSPLHTVLFQAARTSRTTYPQALNTLAATTTEPAAEGHRAWLQAADLLKWCGPLASALWLTADGRQAVAEVVSRAADTARPDALPGAESARLALHRMGEEHATYDQIGRQQWGLPIHAPYLDGSVVDACLAVPGWERWVPGDFKPLARAALTGAVPAYLLQRRTKTPMTASLHLGLRANTAALRRIIKASRLAAAGLIDPKPVLAALDGAIRGERAPLGALHQLVVTELWLSTLPNANAFWQQPIPEQETAA
ncbi:albusnodin/ikarugamycin family macrolactam cyclase [Streptomyces halstedii]|uniref:albusnodin/ikarugamycin family macrolactam cyclase n=1 Tax=Streptomyces halstedii TaxID=1944 RepID=UPI0034613641